MVHVSMSFREFGPGPCVNLGLMGHEFVSEIFHVHLVSDATGETLNAIAKAALAQFDDVNVEQHSYALVRSPKQLERALDHIRAQRGLVFFTLFNPELR